MIGWEKIKKIIRRPEEKVCYDNHELYRRVVE